MATRDPNFKVPQKDDQEQKDTRGISEIKPALTPADRQSNLDRQAKNIPESVDDRQPPQSVKRTPEGTREEGIEEAAP